MVSYFSNSGTEYSVTSEGAMLQQGKELPYEYMGIVDREHAIAQLPPGTSKWMAPEMLYEMKGDLGINEVKFEDVKDFIDGKIALVFVNHGDGQDEPGKLALTSVIAR